MDKDKIEAKKEQIVQALSLVLHEDVPIEQAADQTGIPYSVVKEGVMLAMRDHLKDENTVR